MHMRSWQTLLHFFDCHPWFLPSVAAIITIGTAIYALSRWLLRMIRAWLERREENCVVEYLATQLIPKPNGAEYPSGRYPRRQQQCLLKDIAQAINKKPVKVLAILNRLKEQSRVDGDSHWWRISDHELDGREAKE